MKDEKVKYDEGTGHITVFLKDTFVDTVGGGYIRKQSVDSILLYKILEKLEKIEESITTLNNKTR